MRISFRKLRIIIFMLLVELSCFTRVLYMYIYILSVTIFSWYRIRSNVTISLSIDQEIDSFVLVL